MNSAQAPFHQPLSALASGPRSVIWWGMVLLIVIESVIVLSMGFSYFYLRGGLAEWPPEGIQPPDLLVPTIGLPVLLASAATMYWAESGIRRGAQGRLRLGLLLSLALAGVFLVLMIVDYAARDYSWETNAYGSIVWAMTGFHTAHVVVNLIQTAAVAVLAWRGYFDRWRHMGVQAAALYWYFLVGAWVPIYATVYLAPRLI